MPEMTAPTITDVLAAQARIRPYLKPTPTLHTLRLDEALSAEIFVKCENLQPIGAFKVRGGLNLAAAEGGSRPLVAVSTGNHGQSIAYAARTFGREAMIFVPENPNPIKRAAMQLLGAQVVEQGSDFDEAMQAAEDYAQSHDVRYVHSMNEPLLIAGVGTATLELLSDVPDLEVLYVPIGGGSGAAGALTVARAMAPKLRVIGVQAAGAPAVHRSFHDPERRLHALGPVTTAAEGLATRRAHALPLGILWEGLHDLVLVSDDAMARAIRLLCDTVHQVAEPAGAAALAAAMQDTASVHGRKVGVILSGGNLPVEQLGAWLERGRS